MRSRSPTSKQPSNNKKEAQKAPVQKLREKRHKAQESGEEDVDEEIQLSGTTPGNQYMGYLDYTVKSHYEIYKLTIMPLSGKAYNLSPIGSCPTSSRMYETERRTIVTMDKKDYYKEFELDDEGTREEVARALKESNTKVKELKLSVNKIGAEGAIAIAEALKVNKVLRQLYLSGNNIGEKGAIAIAAALEKNGSLKKLDLEWNEISEKGAIAIAAALEKNGSLQLLYLGRNNNIGENGAIAIAAALEKNGSLQLLYLRSNNIGDVGAIAIAAALEKNRSLQQLVLDRNKIGDAGAIAIAAALENNGSLQLLYLGSNNIGDGGAKRIAKLMATNTTLKKLRLNVNKIGIDGAKSLAFALESNTTFEELELTDNDPMIELEMQQFNEILAQIYDLLSSRWRTRKAQKWYNRALLEGKCRPNRIRLIMSGPFGVGKTSLVRSLLGQPFEEEYNSTEGIEIVGHQMGTVMDFKESLRYWKNDLTSNAILAAHRVENVPKPGPVRKEENVEFHIDEEVLQVLDPPPKQTKLEPQPISDHTDTTKRLSINIWDFAGQIQYHCMHQTFFRPNCLYVHVLDLQTDDSGERISTEEAMLLDAQKWLNSIVSSAGPNIGLVIVGTHCAKFTDEDANARLNTLIDAMGKNITENEFYLVLDPVKQKKNSAIVDNKEGKGVHELKTLIFNVADHMLGTRADVPLRWLRLLDRLLDDQVLQDNHFCVPIERVQEKAASVGISESEELIEALLFFDQSGDVIYVDDDGLKDWVFTQPQLLLDAMKPLVSHKLQLPPVAVKDLLEDGFMGNIALSYVWSTRNFQNQEQLRLVLASTGLILNIDSGIIVPSRLKDHSVDVQPRDNEFEVSVETIVSSHLPPYVFGYVLAKFHDLFGDPIQERGLISGSRACLLLRKEQAEYPSYRLIIIEEKLRHAITLVLRQQVSAETLEVSKQKLADRAGQFTIGLHKILMERFKWMSLKSFVTFQNGRQWNIYETTPESPHIPELKRYYADKHGNEYDLRDAVKKCSSQSSQDHNKCNEESSYHTEMNPPFAKDSVLTVINEDIPQDPESLKEYVKRLEKKEKGLIKWLVGLITLELNGHELTPDETEWVKLIARLYHRYVTLLKLMKDIHIRSKQPYDVFVSHTGVDKDSYAAPLAQYLKDNKVSAFLDRIALSPGVDPTSEMLWALTTCRVMWCVLSENFVKQEWPVRELLIGCTRYAEEHRPEGKGFILVFDCFETGKYRGMWMDKVLKLKSLKVYDKNPPSAIRAIGDESYSERYQHIASMPLGGGEPLVAPRLPH